MLVGLSVLEREREWWWGEGGGEAEERQTDSHKETDSQPASQPDIQTETERQ